MGGWFTPGGSDSDGPRHDVWNTPPSNNGGKKEGGDCLRVAVQVIGFATAFSVIVGGSLADLVQRAVEALT